MVVYGPSGLFKSTKGDEELDLVCGSLPSQTSLRGFWPRPPSVSLFAPRGRELGEDRSNSLHGRITAPESGLPNDKEDASMWLISSSVCSPLWALQPFCRVLVTNEAWCGFNSSVAPETLLREQRSFSTLCFLSPWSLSL